MPARCVPRAASPLLRPYSYWAIKHTAGFATHAARNPSSLLSSEPITVTPTPEEQSRGTFSPHNLQAITRALHRDGLVVLSSIIQPSKLNTLNTKMLSDAQKLASAGDESPYNFNKGNIQQDPPLTSKFFDPDIFMPSLPLHAMKSYLGPQPLQTFLSGNTAIPGFPNSRQPVHSDADFAHPKAPFALVMNVPLVTTTPSNGSTELWLGTHSSASLAEQEGKHGETRASGRIRSELLEERRKERPPCQPIVEQGSVILRDLRLWHAGMPNLVEPSQGFGASRVMLAGIWWASWFRNRMNIEFSSSVQRSLKQKQKELEIEVSAKYLEEEELTKRYLNRPFGNAYDFDQADKLEEVFTAASEHGV